MDKPSGTRKPLLDALRTLLLTKSTWTTWENIRLTARQTGHNIAGWDRRSIAAAAESSLGEILSCTAGYKLAVKSSERDILTSYRQTLRKALGSDRRARSIISYSRSHYLLRDHNVADKIRTEVERDLDIEIPESRRPINPDNSPPDELPRPHPPKDEPSSTPQLELL